MVRKEISSKIFKYTLQDYTKRLSTDPSHEPAAADAQYADPSAGE